MNTISIIEENSFEIKLNYAQLLGDYLSRVQPDTAQDIKNFMRRIENARQSSLGIAKYTLDNVVNSMQTMLQSISPTTNESVPSTSGMVTRTAATVPAPISPPPAPISTPARVLTPAPISTPAHISTPAPISTPPAPMDVGENDFDNDVVSRNMTELKSILSSLLESNTLQTLTRQSLSAFQQLVADSTLMYEDYFKNGIELDRVDCDLNDGVQRFVRIFEKYGPVKCVVTDVNYYAERVRANPDLVESLPPSVRAAVVTILDLVERKSAYTVQININPVEFNGVTDNTVRALLNRYSEHKPIQFNGNNGANGGATPTPMVVDINSTDEDEQMMTQTMRRKRKMRAPTPSMTKSAKRTASQTTPSATTNKLSDDAFIDNVRQMHQPNVIVPKLLMQIVNVVPSDVASSLITCPTNGLSDVKISAQNYNTTIALINKMNLTVITENVYFYKLLEPLTYYGSNEALTTKVLWFIARSANYFTNNARNYNYLRDSLRSLSDDIDRVALFMIRYNFLWFYRQFLGQLLSFPTTPYQSQKIINVLHVYASVVQKEYNKLPYDFNQTRVYVGPVDNVVKLMVVSLSDILA